MSDNCLFCRIARREIPAHILHEDDRLLAFLDIQPVRPGHTLIIPKQHYPYFEDMPADLAGHILNLGQKLGRHMKRLYGVDRVGFAFTGIHVAHAHAHVIPMHDPQDVTSTQYIAEGPHLHHAAAGPARGTGDDRRPTARRIARRAGARRLKGGAYRRAQNKGRSEDLPCRLSLPPTTYSAALSSAASSTSGRSTSSMKAMGALSP